MISVCDTSPGTVLRSQRTGRTYEVREDGDVVVLGDGEIRIRAHAEKLQRDIMHGRMEVRG